MRRTLTAIVLCVALAGCHLEQRPEQAEREKADRAQQADKDRRLKEAEETLRRHTIELGLLWSRTSCNNDTVKEFLRTCEQEETGCNQTDVGNSFSAFLESQERVRAYLKPDLGIESLVRLRQTQLQELVEAQYLHVGTQFIILMLPRSYSQGHQEEAERIGQQVVQYMRETLKLPSTHRILGPKLLPCRIKREKLLEHMRRRDNRQTGEPREDAPTLHLFIFRTDCH